MYEVLIILFVLFSIAGVWLLAAFFVAGCFCAASKFQIEEDQPKWLKEIDEHPRS